MADLGPHLFNKINKFENERTERNDTTPGEIANVAHIHVLILWPWDIFWPCTAPVIFIIQVGSILRIGFWAVSWPEAEERA